MMWADLCKNCLRDCRQVKGTKIITCNKFIEQLGLKFVNAKPEKSKKKKKKETEN